MPSSCQKSRDPTRTLARAEEKPCGGGALAHMRLDARTSRRRAVAHARPGTASMMGREGDHLSATQRPPTTYKGRAQPQRAQRA